VAVAVVALAAIITVGLRLLWSEGRRAHPRTERMEVTIISPPPPPPPPVNAAK
jgi:hypothetical protein